MLRMMGGAPAESGAGDGDHHHAVRDTPGGGDGRALPGPASLPQLP